MASGGARRAQWLGSQTPGGSVWIQTLERGDYVSQQEKRLTWVYKVQRDETERYRRSQGSQATGTGTIPGRLKNTAQQARQRDERRRPTETELREIARQRRFRDRREEACNDSGRSTPIR